MYVINIFLSQRSLKRLLRGTKGCSESVLNNCYFSSLSNRWVLMSCLELLLLAAICESQTTNTYGKLHVHFRITNFNDYK